MNWFTKSNAQQLTADKKAVLAKENDCCEHVEADPNLIFQVSYENDSFGREGYCMCQQCSQKMEQEEGDAPHTCNDCKCSTPLRDGVMWKWYDFYAAQGDEPLFVCNACCKLETHQGRVDRDKRDRDEELGLRDDDFDHGAECDSAGDFDGDLAAEDESIASIEKQMEEQEELRKIFEEQDKLEEEEKKRQKEQEEKDFAAHLEEMRIFDEGRASDESYQPEAIDRAAKEAQEHRDTLARFYRKMRSDKGLRIIVPDIERISCAIESHHPVVLVFSKSRGWLHPFHNSQEWSVWSCNPDGTGEYRLVDTP